LAKRTRLLKKVVRVVPQLIADAALIVVTVVAAQVARLELAFVATRKMGFDPAEAVPTCAATKPGNADGI
jgi:hypothetical protein